ncbi:DUF1206 domain-containing protein [Amycolatopsis sp. H20-H5]|uniref:DUF1206 domain-containing protein n=1 Tax=Amycolatopsis sp. H20-H5 TaxID=3046309 RepID=UPI002DBB9FDB|nr:DUF1206 domain-containing protein [Amycolatopsis sp. H20-H5]MEC3978072.1 DUF1206 domain-containing protein [Amycolatopsis sp. H20-H5]
MADSTASQVKHSAAAQGAGRVGMACFGFVHLVLAYLAVRVALGGGGGQAADQKGALAEIGSTSFGQVVLWGLAAGLLAFGLWQFMMAAIGYSWVGKKGKRIRKRIGSGARGVVVIGLGISAVQLVLGSGSSSGDQKQQEFTAKLLAQPAGQVLVAVAAAAVLGVAIASGVKGFTKEFLEDLDTGELPAGTQRWVTRLGMAGYLAKGAVLAVVAVLLAFAALSADARQAGGLDKALRTMAAQPFGAVLLVVVALGLAAFGVYCFAAARAHKT